MATEEAQRMLWQRWSDYGGDFPPECRDMTCGARTRAGTPCKRRDLYRSGRCKLHGGLSTGPRTAKGKRRSARNGKGTTKGKPHGRVQKPNDLGKSSRAPQRGGG
ncbi:HGGxSTG domain-containing protein [Aurantiacibacter poecillastricola]|uniref:HGGxSTG domain-containing protein n=1 Tax=Aurantiacibacter poecillastricola TaxID=3064385 RepID=UPI0035315808